jgi:hypothetical protein
MIALTKSGLRQNIAAFRAAIFKLKKSKHKEFAAKKISEWRKLTKKIRKIFKVVENMKRK